MKTLKNEIFQRESMLLNDFQRLNDTLVKLGEKTSEEYALGKGFHDELEVTLHEGTCWDPRGDERIDGKVYHKDLTHHYFWNDSGYSATYSVRGFQEFVLKLSRGPANYETYGIEAIFINDTNAKVPNVLVSVTECSDKPVRICERIKAKFRRDPKRKELEGKVRDALTQFETKCEGERK